MYLAPNLVGIRAQPSIAQGMLTPPKVYHSCAFLRTEQYVASNRIHHMRFTFLLIAQDSLVSVALSFAPCGRSNSCELLGFFWCQDFPLRILEAMSVCGRCEYSFFCVESKMDFDFLLQLHKKLDRNRTLCYCENDLASNNYCCAPVVVSTVPVVAIAPVVTVPVVVVPVVTVPVVVV